MSQAEINLYQLHYQLPDNIPLFKAINWVFSPKKIGLVGKNGCGKSTLLKLIHGELKPSFGTVLVTGEVAYLPQKFQIPTDLNTTTTIAELMGCEAKIAALHRIEQGSVNELDFQILNDDWDVMHSLTKQLHIFGLEKFSYNYPLSMLSGGELTKLLLTKVFCSNADFLLLDEPTNHLDSHARQLLYQAISEWQGGLIIASHDRELLNLLDEIVEISPLGLQRFGGNYAAFKVQKDQLINAQQQQLHAAKHLVAQTKKSIQNTKEKHERRKSHGELLRRRCDQPKILLDAMENRSTSGQKALLIRHSRMLENAEQRLKAAKDRVLVNEEIQVDLQKTYVPNSKVILALEKIVFAYPKMDKPIINHFDLIVRGSERIAIVGDNGSGKTTLMNLILGRLTPNLGTIYVGTKFVCYADQNANLLDPELSVLDNFLLFNPDAQHNEAHAKLAQFLFKNVKALQLVKHLSGGEKLRALLACVLLAAKPPQLLILDEPTNHLDLDSIISIENALNQFQGALFVASHDKTFLEKINIERFVLLHSVASPQLSS